jgi:hypothetical protein
MGAGLAIIALIGGAASVAIVGYHGILIAFLTASIGGSFSTLLVAFLADGLRGRTGDEAHGDLLAPAAPEAEPAGPA